MKGTATIISYGIYDGQEVPVISFAGGRIVAVVGDEYTYLHPEQVKHSRFPDEPAKKLDETSEEASDQPDVEDEPAEAGRSAHASRDRHSRTRA